MHEVELQELERHLSEYMKKVQDGDTIVVRRDEITIARILPVRHGLTWEHIPEPGMRLQDVRRPENMPELDFDVVETLREDRDAR